MSLDTYLRIVQALEITPMALMNQIERPEGYMEYFFFLVERCNKSEIEIVLDIVERILKGKGSYLGK
ncbi:hypothetical protein AALC25_10515 [Lachnospiraceae bacterium 29-84]